MSGGVTMCSAVAFTLIMTAYLGTSPVCANPTCILNCAQCVQLYGQFFDGPYCAQVCIEARNRYESYIDCADPTNIARFIKNKRKSVSSSKKWSRKPKEWISQDQQGNVRP